MDRPKVLVVTLGGTTTYRETYGFAGSEIDLLSRGLIYGGTIGPYKARLLPSPAARP